MRNTAPKQTLGAVRPEFLLPEARPFFLSFLEMLNGRMRMVSAYRRLHMPHMSILDGMVNFQIFIFTIIGGDGSRQSDITEVIDAPRSTVRDSLRRLTAAGLIVRTRDGRYHTTPAVIEMANISFDENMNQCMRLADATATYNAAIGRIPPSP